LIGCCRTGFILWVIGDFLNSIFGSVDLRGSRESVLLISSLGFDWLL